MEKEELTAVLDALGRINRCLDERFEKNADLYIAPEQTEKLKKLIYLGNYPQIVKEYSLKKYSAEVLANVLIKNAWLMRNSNYKLLDPIFEACNQKYLQGIMQESVFDNKIEMPSGFRLKLIALFLENGEPIMCRQMLKQKLLFLNHPLLKAICVRRALKDEPLLERYQQFDAYAQKSLNLLTQQAILSQLFPANEFTDILREKIFQDHIANNSPLRNFWVNLATAEDIPFFMTQFKKYCRANPTKLLECRKVFARLYPVARNDFATFAEKFAEACACMDGDRKSKLAQTALNHVISTEQENILTNALNRHGIAVAEKGGLADKSEIIKRISTDEDFLFHRELSWLTTSFDKQYRDTCESVLDDIGRALSSEDRLIVRFEDFCLALLSGRFWQLRYLIYAIDELVPSDADKNNPFVAELLNHIRNKDILNKQKYYPNIAKVINFVRAKDFELFTELIHF